MFQTNPMQYKILHNNLLLRKILSSFFPVYGSIVLKRLICRLPNNIDQFVYYLPW